MPLDPAMRLVLDALDKAGGARLHQLEPAQARDFFEQFELPRPEIALPSVEDRGIPGPAGEIPVRIYRPEAGGTLPALVYFHGGGWVIGSLDTHDASCRELASQTGCVVVSVDYRLAPEHRYPAAAEDCFAAVRWVADHAAELGVDPARLAVGGDSAGGNLSAVVSLLARDRSGPALRFQLLVYPVTDCDFSRPSYLRNASGLLLERDTMLWFWDHYVPDAARRREPHCAPLHAESLAGLPPALVITAEYDPLLDEGEAYVRRLEEAGVPTTCTRYDGMVHGFFAMGMLAQGARDAVAQASEALRKSFA